MITKKFTPTGVAAIDPQALAIDFVCGPPAPDCTSFETHGVVAVVSISGPLTYAAANFDTYAAAEARFTCALTSAPKAVVLRIASPGGDVSGSFDCARNMKRKAREAGIPLIAYSDDKACSAAYVLACAADRIFCSDTATLGSIGCIIQPVDTSRADAAMGLRFEVISSGARKADGNPHVPLSDDARAAIQQSIDAMAEVFYAHVGDARPTLGATGAAALQAGVCVGRDAVAGNLADGVMGFAELIVMLNADPMLSAIVGGHTSSDVRPPTEARSLMPDDTKPDDKDKDKPKEDAMRASLVTASESDDEKKAASAKRALAAYDADEGDDDKKKKDDDEKASAAAAATAAKAAVAATEAAIASATLQSVAAELAEMKAAALATDRASLFASRADLPKAAIDAVRELPLATAKAILASLPVIVNPLAPLAIKATAGDTSVTGGAVASLLTAEQSAQLDAAFGLVPATALGVVEDGCVQRFGVLLPVKA